MQSHEIIDEKNSDDTVPSKTYFLNMPAGYYVSWFCTTQTSNQVTVTLFDEHHVYFSTTRQNANSSPPLSFDHAQIEGNNLQLKIDIITEDMILNQKSSYLVLDDKYNPIGKVISIAIEDGDDQDYNDVYFNIIGWKNTV